LRGIETENFNKSSEVPLVEYTGKTLFFKQRNDGFFNKEKINASLLKFAQENNSFVEIKDAKGNGLVFRARDLSENDLINNDLKTLLNINNFIKTTNIKYLNIEFNELRNVLSNNCFYEKANFLEEKDKKKLDQILGQINSEITKFSNFSKRLDKIIASHNDFLKILERIKMTNKFFPVREKLENSLKDFSRILDEVAVILNNLSEKQKLVKEKLFSFSQKRKMGLKNYHIFKFDYQKF
jgi:hypothetical protein